ncbi:hypothetical protein Fmac_031292 [Flemingia macrophylla]|uniref:Exocyst subunit Exo70 family protein n=1 Tax=Flemingia macrophylla TaxID=520843 RepID=A0ABD1L1P5_9FABA
MRLLLTQNTRCLTQVAVWRFVGFVSTFVGLLFYALSSSFNYLFGEWSLLKIFLYSLFSVFICLWSLFAKVCQHSASLRFKAHSAFTVLTITSLFSYFSEKVAKGKPDAYSLISCVAFVIMSFSLSRQTECGFEVELFYFFLGCLIVLLMKINLALAIVGVGFTYSLVILRYSLNTVSYENLEVQAEHSVAIDVISLSTDNARNSMMQRLMACMKALGMDNSNVASMLLEHKKRKRKYGYKLVSVDHNYVIDALPSEKVNELEETIKLMVGDGFEKECCDEYCNWRRKSLEECLRNLFRLQEHKREGKELEEYIVKRWIKVVKVALRILFPSERRLSGRVFSGLSSVAELCFIEVCREATIQLLNLADAVVSGSPTVWRLSKIIDMFERLHDLIPEFESLFPESLVNEVMAVHDKLGEASRDMFWKMEDIIFLMPDEKVIAEADGWVHPLTKYVMGYLDFTHRKQHILDQILVQYPYDEAGASSVSNQIDRIMKQLERKLVTMSESYKDPALRHFIMMNNWKCIQILAKESGLNHDCFVRCIEIVQQNRELYISSWKTVLEFLKVENNELGEPDDTVESLKDKLTLFHKHFKDIFVTQSRWIAFDKQLSEQIVISLQNILLPAYGNFIGRFQDTLGKHAYEYIKYGMFDIEDQLNHLFDGRGQ